jgi:hypothetical protein
MQAAGCESAVTYISAVPPCVAMQRVLKDEFTSSSLKTIEEL